MHDNSSRHLVRVDYGFFRAERLTNRSSGIEQGLVLIITTQGQYLGALPELKS